MWKAQCIERCPLRLGRGEVFRLRLFHVRRLRRFIYISFEINVPVRHCKVTDLPRGETQRGPQHVGKAKISSMNEWLGELGCVR